MGKPVIGCAGQGVDGIIKHGVSGYLVQPNDVDSLAEVIRYLLEHEKVAEKVGEEGKSVANEYTWDAHVRKLTQLYEQVALSRSHQRITGSGR